MKLFLIPVFAIGIVLSFTSCKPKSEKLNNDLNTDFVPVKLIDIGSSQNQNEIAATGLVTTENEAKYAFKIGGVIQSILVEEGQFFKKGQLLATLNRTEIGAGLDQAKLNVEKAKRDYSRTLNLYRDSVNTLEQVQNAKTGLDVAQKAADIVAFNAQYSKIYASSDGFVVKKLANVGEVIATGTPVLAINESKGGADYTLKVGVTDKEWVGIELGQTAKITLDGFPGDTINGKVFRKSQSSDMEDGSFQIEIKLQPGKDKPAIGMFGKVQIVTRQKTSHIIIPYEALIEADGDRAFVFTVSGKHGVKRVPIVIASFNNNEVYVKSGLENTKQVIVSNSAFLNEQSKIKIIK